MQLVPHSAQLEGPCPVSPVVVPLCQCTSGSVCTCRVFVPQCRDISPCVDDDLHTLSLYMFSLLHIIIVILSLLFIMLHGSTKQ